MLALEIASAVKWTSWSVFLKNRGCYALMILTLLSWVYFQGLPIFYTEQRYFNFDSYIVLSVSALLAVLLGMFLGGFISCKSYCPLWQKEIMPSLILVTIASFPVTLVYSIYSFLINFTYGYGVVDALMPFQNLIAYALLTIMPIFVFAWNGSYKSKLFIRNWP